MINDVRETKNKSFIKKQQQNKHTIFFDKLFIFKFHLPVEEPQENPVKVDTILLTICHKKRKDVTTPIMQVCKTAFSLFKIKQCKNGSNK